MAVLTFGNSCLTYSGNLLKFTDPYNPLELPPYTIRLLYPDEITPTFSRGDSVQVSVSPNVWDLTTVNVEPSSDGIWPITGPEDWRRLLKDDYDVIAVLGANSTGVTLMDLLFSQCTHLSSVALFDTSLVTSTEYMFAQNYLLSSIPSYDLSNNTNMRAMFMMCHELRRVPMFNTSKVTSMESTFYQSGLEEMPLWDTRNVTTMSAMFKDAGNLTTVPLLNTSKVVDISFMFANSYSDSSLISLPCFDTSNVTDMHQMLAGCYKLTVIPNFNTDKVTDISSAFDHCFGVNGGALSLYQRISSQQVPPVNHKNTFLGTGYDTVIGRAELEQIPRSWGGLKEE